MSQTNSKIFGLIIFICTLAVLVYVAFMPPQNSIGRSIKSVTISGSQLLPPQSYLDFAKVSGIKNSPEVTPAILKHRIEKHPFISSAEVEISKLNTAAVNVREKSLAAMVICGGQTYLLSDDLQLLPIFSNTKSIDLPIINNVENSGDYRTLQYLESSEIIQAYNILTAIKYVNSEMFSNLSEINLNNADGIRLTFTGIHPQIKFGRNNVPGKVLCLDSIWNKLKKSDYEMSSSDYIDLRFTDQIYIGKSEEKEI